MRILPAIGSDVTVLQGEPIAFTIEIFDYDACGQACAERGIVPEVEIWTDLPLTTLPLGAWSGFPCHTVAVHDSSSGAHFCGASSGPEAGCDVGGSDAGRVVFRSFVVLASLIPGKYRLTFRAKAPADAVSADLSRRVLPFDWIWGTAYDSNVGISVTSSSSPYSSHSTPGRPPKPVRTSGEPSLRQLRLEQWNQPMLRTMLLALNSNLRYPKVSHVSARAMFTGAVLATCVVNVWWSNRKMLDALHGGGHTPGCMHDTRSTAETKDAEDGSQYNAPPAQVLSPTGESMSVPQEHIVAHLVDLLTPLPFLCDEAEQQSALLVCGWATSLSHAQCQLRGADSCELMRFHAIVDSHYVEGTWKEVEDDGDSDSDEATPDDVTSLRSDGAGPESATPRAARPVVEMHISRLPFVAMIIEWIDMDAGHMAERSAERLEAGQIYLPRHYSHFRWALIRAVAEAWPIAMIPTEVIYWLTEQMCIQQVRQCGPGFFEYAPLPHASMMLPRCVCVCFGCVLCRTLYRAI